MVPFELPFKVKNEKEEPMRYVGRWEFMSSLKGIWYLVGTERNGIFSAYNLVSECKDHPNSSFYPYWIIDKNVKSDLSPLNFAKGTREKILEVIKFFVNESPLKTILFLARFQCLDHEIVCGILTLKEFLDLHDEEKICFNTCYIIRK